MRLFAVRGNKLKHPSECTILKVVVIIVLGGHAPGSTLCHISPSVLAQSILPPRPSFYSGGGWVGAVIPFFHLAYMESNFSIE